MFLENFYQEILNSEGECLDRLDKNPFSFIHFDDKWKENKKIVLYAIDKYAYNYKYISPILKKDLNIIYRTIFSNPFLFSIVPKELRDNKEICLLAIELG